MNKSEKTRCFKDLKITRRVLRNSMSERNALDPYFSRSTVVRAFNDCSFSVYFLLHNASFRWEGTREGYKYWQQHAHYLEKT